MIHLEDITEENWRTPLSVSDAQKAYVADSTTILARAYAYRNSRSRAYLIFNDDLPVGMGLYHDDAEAEAYIFSELFIDERYQRQGFGTEATRQVLDILKADGKYHRVILCYIDGNDAARGLYESFGFAEIDRDEDEIIMELRF